MARKKTTRSSYGGGSIQREDKADGSERWRWLYRKGGVRKSSPRFKDKQELLQWIAEYQASGGATENQGKDTFSQAADRWLNSRDCAPARLSHYQGTLRNHLLPSFKGARLQDITSDHLNEYARAKLEGSKTQKSLSRKTVFEHLWIVRSIYERAIGTGYFSQSNPAAKHLLNVKTPDKGKGKLKHLTKSEQRKLWGACPEDDKPLLAVLLLCGLRASEAAALMWKHWVIHPEDSSLSYLDIEQAVKQDDKIGLPKSDHSIGRLTCSAEFTAIIKAHHRRQKAKGVDVFSSSLIFPRADGSHYTRQTLNRNWLAPIVKNAEGVPRITPHWLRHTFAINCINDGIDIVRISKMMRHHNPGFTLNVYADFLDQSLPPVPTLNL